MPEIHMDSSVTQSVTRAVPKAAVLSCTACSSRDVYATVLWVVVGDIRQFTLHAGDSMVVPEGATMTIWLFRKNPGGSTWTADFELA